MDGMLDLIDFTGSGVAPGLRPVPGVPKLAKDPHPATPRKLGQDDERKVQELLIAATHAHNSGKRAKLKKILEQILEIDKENDQALFNLGIIYRDEKQNAKAEVTFRRALKSDPEKIDAYQALGDLLFNVKHVLSAVKIYEAGLKRAPNRLPLLVNLLRSRILMRQPRDVEALARRILAIQEEEPDIHCYLAWALLRQGKKLDEAMLAAKRAVELKPGHIRGMIMQEQIALAQDDQLAAAAAHEWLLEKVRSGDIADIRNLNEMYLWLDRVSDSTQFLQEYLQLHPDDAEAESTLIQVVMYDGDFTAAQKLVDKLALLFPEKKQLQVSRCLNRFRMGHFAEAMAEMDCRWERNGAGQRPDYPGVDWKGEEIRDGKLVIYSEQGVGDHVMYAGQMVAAREKARHIAFDITSRQMSLFQRSFPDFEVVEFSNLPPGWRNEDVRAKVAAADVAWVLGKDFNDLPGRDGVLIPDPDLLRKLRGKYQAKYPGKLLVGISWRSGNRDSAAIRSLELENWLPILTNKDCAYVSLQYGDVERDVEEMKTEHGVEIYVDKTVDPMGNMDPFTAQVAAMDIVISVDNSTIHYAAALGKPVWMMMPINSDWRWLTDGDKSIWYDSLVLFRQFKGDTWEGMTAKIGALLADVDAAALTTAHVNMLKRCAETLQRYGRPAEAEDYCRLLLEAGAHKDVALHGIGVAAMGAGKPDEAVAILARAVELAPERADIRADLAVALDAAGDSAPAERLARETVRQNAGSEPALIAMGRILTRQGRFDEATDFFARVLRAQPDHIYSRIQLAKLLAAQGEWELARANFDKALAFAPTSAVAHVGAAEVALRQGDWEAGWSHWGWRFGTRPGLLPRHLQTIDPKKYPASWDGAHLRRKRVFVRAERSLAEQLLFAPLLAEAQLEARYILAECEASLLPFLRAAFPKVEFAASGTLSPQDVIDKRIQLVSSLGDLAGRYRAKSADFAGAEPLRLAADPALTAQLSHEYREALPGKRLVALSWRGAEWSIKSVLADWLALFDTEDIGVVAVQRNTTEAELATFAETGRQMIVDPRAREGLGTYAAQIASADVVIAVDDATAHLAALLGKKVVKPASLIDHWCWGAANAPQLWHPNVTTVFQATGQSVADVIAQSVAAAIEAA